MLSYLHQISPQTCTVQNNNLKLHNLCHLHTESISSPILSCNTGTSNVNFFEPLDRIKSYL